MANDPGWQIRKLQAEAQALLDDRGMAVLDDARLHPFKEFIHFWVLVGKSFVRNRCLVRSSALAYTTLLALIPLLAVGLGVSTSLLKSGEAETKEMITKLIDELAPQLGNIPGTVEEKAEARLKIVEQIQSFIKNIHSGALGLSGTVALVFVAIGLLSTIEATFNDIWGVPRGRNWFARLIHYWAAITLGPLVVVLVMGSVIGSQLPAAARDNVTADRTGAATDSSGKAPATKANAANPDGGIQSTNVDFMTRTQSTVKAFKLTFWGRLCFKVLPFFVLSGSFMLLYQLMPNTRVHWKAAMVGGLVAGSLWIGNSSFNALFASRVVSASKIYGPLGALPIFLLGLYLSWTILLFGSQVAYAFQNRRAYAQEKQAEVVNQRGREFIALRVMTLVGQRFHRGEKPPGTAEIAESLSVSSRLVSQVIQPLLQTKLLFEVNSPETAYSPARPLDRITCQDILQTLRAGVGQSPATREEPARELVKGAFDEIRAGEERVAGSLTLHEMVRRTEAGDKTRG